MSAASQLLINPTEAHCGADVRRNKAVETLAALSLAAMLISAPNSVLAETMTFEVRPSPTDCADCLVIEAEGPITASTPKDFQEFLLKQRSGKNFSRTVILLDSKGGDLAGGLKLGIVLRDQGVEAEMPGTPWAPAEDEAPNCLSACAYAFLGARYRNFGRDDYLAFHQFSGSSLDVAGNIKGVSGAAILRDQYVTGVLVSYIQEMGIAPRLFELASANKPDELLFITRVLAQDLGILTDVNAVSPWQLLPLGSGIYVKSSMLHGNLSLGLYCRSDEPDSFRMALFLEVDEKIEMDDMQRLGDLYQADRTGESISILLDKERIAIKKIVDQLPALGVILPRAYHSSDVLIDRSDLKYFLGGSEITLERHSDFQSTGRETITFSRRLPVGKNDALSSIILSHCI